jgi:glycosyltransferase involved in cell wall biosynthesis
MRIAIDARYIQAEFTGIGIYSEGLLQALSRQDTQNEFIVFVHSSFRGDLALGENFEIIPDDSRPVSLRTIGSLGLTLRRYGVETLHSLFPLIPLTWKGYVLQTVHDLQPLLDPAFSSRRGTLKKAAYDLFYRFSYPACMRKADYIIADSYATMDHITEVFPDVRRKILVINGGVTAEAFRVPSEDEIARVRQKYDIPKKFLFYLGSTRPNKNLPMMLDAFEAFINEHPEQDDLYLVLVVRADRFFEPLFAQIRERGLLRRIHIHEQISQSEKTVFYRLATLLYFATKFEGFGMPLLEAQAAGLPVLASTHAALPEIAGSTAILCDPGDLSSIVRGLTQFFTEPGLPARMVEAGLQNVQRFSWDRAAKEVLDMYNHLLG